MRIACFGDSLTEGYGVSSNASLPAVLQAMLADSGITARCLNFGVSGDTTFDGLRRLSTVLSTAPDGVILEFGANDAFMLNAPQAVRDNLDRLIEPFAARGVPVLLAGISALPELGRAYKNAFDPLFAEAADRFGLDLFPDIMAPYFKQPGLTLVDGLHPNEQGIKAIARAMLPQVRRLIGQAENRKDLAPA